MFLPRMFFIRFCIFSLGCSKYGPVKKPLLCPCVRNCVGESVQSYTACTDNNEMVGSLALHILILHYQEM